MLSMSIAFPLRDEPQRAAPARSPQIRTRARLARHGENDQHLARTPGTRNFRARLRTRLALARLFDPRIELAEELAPRLELVIVSVRHENAPPCCSTRRRMVSPDSA